MSNLDRRDFLTALAALGACAFSESTTAGRIRPGYAAITWGGKDDQAIDEIAQVGFKAIQLRATAFDEYGTRPAALKERLAKRGLTFAVLSSGNLKYQPADRDAQIALPYRRIALTGSPPPCW
jgi:inosose dehydratase